MPSRQDSCIHKQMQALGCCQECFVVEHIKHCHEPNIFKTVRMHPLIPVHGAAEEVLVSNILPYL